MISAPNDPHDRARYTSDSRDCVDIFYDGPGDKTVRPATGESLEMRHGRARANRAVGNNGRSIAARH